MAMPGISSNEMADAGRGEPSPYLRVGCGTIDGDGSNGFMPGQEEVEVKGGHEDALDTGTAS
jgi:hypothetical protein